MDWRNGENTRNFAYKISRWLVKIWIHINICIKTVLFNLLVLNLVFLTDHILRSEFIHGIYKLNRQTIKIALHGKNKAEEEQQDDANYNDHLFGTNINNGYKADIFFKYF
jgi:hypothetical protein